MNILSVMKVVKYAINVCFLIMISACSSIVSSSPDGSPIVLFEPSKELLAFSLTAVAKLNPDQNGRPSPLSVRVYQLSSDALFRNADFYKLLDDDAQVLNRDIQQKQQFMVYPGEQRSRVDIVISRKTRFIGIVGEFRDLDNAAATLLIPINPEEPRPLCLSIHEKALSSNHDC